MLVIKCRNVCEISKVLVNYDRTMYEIKYVAMEHNIIETET